MKNLEKTTTKFRLGGGLNALCFACAGYIGVRSLIKLGDWLAESKARKLVKEYNALIHDVKKYGVADESMFED